MNARIEGGCPASVVDDAMNALIADMGKERMIYPVELEAMQAFLDAPSSASYCAGAVAVLCRIVQRLAAEGVRD
jgi:hypothetical protein